MKSKNDKSEKNISRLLKQSQDSTVPSEKFTQDLIAKSLNELSQQQPGKKNRGKSVRLLRLAKITAAAVIILAVSLFVDYRRPGRQINDSGTTKVVPASASPSGMMSVISLNMIFRDGDMEAIEKHLDKAERKTKSKLKEHLTIDQLICELDGC